MSRHKKKAKTASPKRANNIETAKSAKSAKSAKNGKRTSQTQMDADSLQNFLVAYAQTTPPKAQSNDIMPKPNEGGLAIPPWIHFT